MMMKFLLVLILISLQLLSFDAFTQNILPVKRFGINTGATGDFYLNRDASIRRWVPYLYLAPSFQLGRNEIYAGINCPLHESFTNSNVLSDHDISPRVGVLFGYKYYIFKPQQKVNVFFHYSFNYLHYHGPTTGGSMGHTWFAIEDQKSFNNEFGYGLILYFNKKQTIGLCFTQRYLINYFTYSISPYTVNGGDRLDGMMRFNCFNLSIGLQVVFHQIAAKHNLAGNGTPSSTF